MISFFYTKKDSARPSIRLDIIHRHDESAKQVRRYIADIYHKNYQASIHPDPDILISCKNKTSGELVACAGISAPPPLFSERYLDLSLKETVLQKTKRSLNPANIAEIGSLASDNPNAAANLIRIIPIIAGFMGYEALLCTSTYRLRKLLAFHRIPFCILADASIDRLPDAEREAWGSYYNEFPKTCIILLDQCGHLFNHFAGRLIFSEFEQLQSAFSNNIQVPA